MQTFKWTFRPGLAASLATLILLPTLIGLGHWQVRRAEEKQTLFDAYQARSAASVLDLNIVQTVDIPLEGVQWRKARLQGRYENSLTLLLDNQVLNGTAGYHVFNAFDSGGAGPLVMVNRGWVAGGNYRHEVPQVPVNAGWQTLSGILTAYPSPPGIVLPQTVAPELVAPGIYRMQTLSRKEVETVLGKPVTDYVLRLSPDAATGFDRQWSEPGSGRERHLGYAFQWFSMAVALVIIYIGLNLRRREIE